MPSSGVLAQRLYVEVEKDTSAFIVYVDGERWTAGERVAVHAGGQWYSNLDQSLQLTHFFTYRGQDDLGRFNASVFTWSGKYGGKDVDMLRTVVADYSPYGVSGVRFDQIYLIELNGTSVGDSQSLISAFPSFTVEGEGDMGFLMYYNQMLGGMAEGTQYGLWEYNTTMVGGTAGGPAVVFNANASAAVVISPWFNVMAMSAVQNTSLAGNLEFGLLGSITSIPKGYVCQTMLYLDAGINLAVRRFGENLRRFNQVPTSFPRFEYDISLSHVGYYTDNGAYYYYLVSPQYSSYQQELQSLIANTSAQGIPFQTFQIDSWWYFKGVNNGVKNWTAMPEVFPTGLSAFHDTIKMPIVAHNRYWSSDTDYAKQNGGQYDFIVEETLSIPVEERFWSDLIGNATLWGLTIYEQDWLHNEWEGLNCTLESPTLARDWLIQMGAGAAEHGVSVQYCMAYPRFALQSAEIPNVNQIRVSDDYYVDVNHKYNQSVNLYIGTSSMLAAGLGLAPSKDVFWSTSVQSGNPYGPTAYEQAPELQSVIATFSCGPVVPGDAIGMVNASLVAQCHSADGTILKPSYPFTPLDSYFLQKAFGSGGPQGEVYRTYTALAQYSFLHLVAFDLQTSYTVRGDEFIDREDAHVEYVLYNHAATSLQHFTIASSFALAPCKQTDFQLYHGAPLLSGIAFLGELSKWTVVSTMRTRAITAHSNDLVVELTGAPYERVEVTFAQYNNVSDSFMLFTIPCVFGSSRSASASFLTKTCN